MIADPVSLKRIHIACTVMLSFAGGGAATVQVDGRVQTPLSTGESTYSNRSNKPAGEQALLRNDLS